MPDLTTLPVSTDTLIGYATSLILAVLVLVVGWVASKWVRKVALTAGRRSMNEAAARFFSGVAQYAVLAATVITALGAVGVETTSLIAVFASAGLAVGLALQGSLSSFAAGAMILVFKPFDLGDKVNIAGNVGDVVDIGVFATTLHTADNKKVIVPNAAITSGTIINMTTLGQIRGTVEVGVAYGADAVEVIRVLEGAARRVPQVLQDPAPGIAFVGLGASSLDFAVHTWCNAPDYLNMLHEVRRAVYDDLNAAGIEIPFQQIVIHQANG